MDRLAIIQEQKIVETTVRFCISKTIQTIVRLAIIREQKKTLKQRLDFPFQEKIETMDRLAIIQEQ